MNIPYEGYSSANHNDRKLDDIDRKLEGGHSMKYTMFRNIKIKCMWNV